MKRSFPSSRRPAFRQRDAGLRDSLLECPAIPLPIEHLDHARPTRTLFNGKPVPPGHTHCPQGRYNRLFWAPRGIKMKSKRSIVLSLLDRKSTRLNSSHANISYAV